MEESKELQTAYKIFRTLIYVSVVVEFFMYAIRPEMQYTQPHEGLDDLQRR